MKIIDLVVEALKPVLEQTIDEEKIRELLETPSYAEHGDMAFPVFVLAKHFKKSPNLIAENLVQAISSDKFEKIVAEGPYINFFLKREYVSDQVLHQVLEEREEYGSQNIGDGGNVPIDMSSPNIAKPMSLGHLRSTVIGESLARIFEKMNYTSIRINHLGDWGTQFGKLIVAYEEWGDPEIVELNPVTELVNLYVEFHERAELDPALEVKARAKFRKLEQFDPEVVQLWEWFKEESIIEFERVYQLLNIKFDYYTGESFYNDKMQPIIDELKEKNISEIDNEAIIVDLEDEDLPPALIQKSDGATLYLTRDLATAYYRKKTFDFSKSLYVVGNEQTTHFKQLKAVLRKLGNEWADDMIHVPFGLITFEGKKLSTRQGNTVLLEDVLNEAIRLAKAQIEAKNPDVADKEEVARKVGVGAVVFHDLKNSRLNNFDFKLEEIVQFEGETGPYVQYTYARANSILERYNQPINLEHMFKLDDDYSWEVIKRLENYQQIVLRATEAYEPSIIAKYVLDLAQAFNRYYGNVRIHIDDQQLESRIALVNSVMLVIQDALHLLGVEALEEM